MRICTVKIYLWTIMVYNFINHYSISRYNSFQTVLIVCLQLEKVLQLFIFAFIWPYYAESFSNNRLQSIKLGNRGHVYAIFVMNAKSLSYQNISDIRSDLNDYTKLPREINRRSRKKSENSYYSLIMMFIKGLI